MFFACYFSQNRISPLEAAAFFRFQSQSLFIVTPTCLCPFINPSWMNECVFMRKASGDTSLGQKSQSHSSLTEQGLELPSADSRGTQHCHAQHCRVLMHLDKFLPVTANINSVHYSPPRMCTSFQTKIKMQ